MRITRRQLKFLIREHLLLSEAHDPGEVVQVGPVSVLIYGRYDVGTAPFYLVYLPKGTKLDGNDVMTPTDSDIDGWIKNKRVTWGKQANGSSWKENPQRLKKLAKEGRFKFLNDFAKAKGINVGGAGGAYKTFATDIGLEAVGALGETFAGIAASVGAVLVSREAGLSLKEVKLNDFGQAKSLTLTKGWTTIVGGKGDWEEIDTRIAAVKNEIEQTENLQECERLHERITRLASGVAVVRVGAATEVEMIEKKHRIDDALEAVRSEVVIVDTAPAILATRRVSTAAALSETMFRLALRRVSVSAAVPTVTEATLSCTRSMLACKRVKVIKSFEAATSVLAAILA